MSKRQTYLFLLAMGLILLLIGRFMHVSYINHVASDTFAWIQNPMIFGPAAICAFVFINNKKYWMINTAAALIVSLIIQYVVVKTGGSLYVILIRSFAFLVVVYLLNLIKVILDK